MLRLARTWTACSFHSKAKAVNTSAADHLMQNLGENRESKQKFGFDPFAILPLKGSAEFQSIRQQIFRCKDGHSIQQLLQSTPTKFDSSVYTAAITKCGELGDTKHAAKMIKIMRKHQVQRDRNCYSILFRALALNEKSYEFPKYLQWMMAKDGIKPDIVCATILIGGCKKRGDVETAETVWNDMILKFGMEPTELTFVQMLSVYAKAGDTEKAQRTFKDMMECGIPPNQSSCGALMQCFANCMDIGNVIKIKQFMLIKGIPLDVYQYRSMMSVYLKNKMPLKALQVYNEYLESLKKRKHRNDGNEVVPHKDIIGMKNATFLMMLEENVERGIDDSNTAHYHQMVTVKTLDEIKQFYGTKSPIVRRLAHNVLTAHVLYHWTLKGDEQRTMTLFRNLCEEQQIGYWLQNKDTGQWMLDFHHFGYISTKFLLQYLLKYERESVLEMDDILILCGKGYHRDAYSSDQKHPEQRGLMNFVQNELFQMSSVPIRSQKCHDNQAVLRVIREDIIAYAETLKVEEHSAMDNDEHHQMSNETQPREYIEYGDPNRKKLSAKYLNELMENLKPGIEIEVFNDQAQEWEPVTIKSHQDKADFDVFDLTHRKERRLNFKCVKYRIVKER